MIISNYLRILFVFTLIFGTLEIINNKYIDLFLPFARFFDKIKLTGLIYSHYAYYFLLYFTVWWFASDPSSFPVSWMIGFFILVAYTLWTWYAYDNKCWLTVKTNEIIGTDDNFGFRDPYDIIMNRYPVVGDNDKITFRDKLYYWYVYLVLGVMAYLIWKRM
jgi:hypothetical protein